MRTCKTRSASVRPDIREYMDSKNLSMTDVLHEWYDAELECNESTRLRRRLVALKKQHETLPAEIASLEKEIEIVLDREDRLTRRRLEREEKLKNRRVANVRR